MSYLTYADEAQAQEREAQISAVLGYPTETYPHYTKVLEHPDGEQWALYITTACDTTTDPYSVRDVAEMLTPQEQAALLTVEQMQEAGWFPDPGPDPLIEEGGE